ncbi:MAG: DMT family transporter [Pseudomonadota bacterium]
MNVVPIMLVVCALLAATTLFAKLLGTGPDGLGLHPLQISAGRFFFAWLAIASIAALRPPSLSGANWRWHFARASCGWGSATCLFAAAGVLPLASANALSFLSPLVAMFLSIFVLGERVGAWRWSAASIAMTGALILTAPGTETFQPAALIAIAAAVFMGIEAMFIKRLSDTEPPVRILLINNSIGVALSVTAALFVWQWPSETGWGYLAALGFTMISAQALFIQAMKRADASLTVPMFYTILVFAAVFDLAVFGIIPTWQAVAGACLIVVGAVVISLRGRTAT